jgi:hypothetical protein
MGNDMAVKLNKYHKPRLIEAIMVCMARIDLLEAGNIRSDGNVRAELKELKAAVFANVSIWSSRRTRRTSWTGRMLDGMTSTS